MKHRSMHRYVAALLAVVMVLAMAITGIRPAQAAEVTYTLDATADLTAFDKGAKADGDNEDVGTEGYFTVFYSANTKVDGSNKTFDDGYTATQRLNFGGKSAFGEVVKNAVMFKTENAAKVKIWWVSGGDGREMAICDASGNVLTATDAAESVKNTLYISELTLDAAGTYYLAVPTGSNYLFRMDVTEQIPETPVSSGYVLDATADLTAFAAGEKADGDNEAVGTNGYFTVFYSAKTKVDGSNKTFDDGYTATQRLNFGGKSDFGEVIKNAVMFKTGNAAKVKIWWVSGGDGREMAICDASGSVVTATDAAESVKNSLYISELTLDAAGTYYLAVPTGSNYLFKLEVTEEVAQEPVVSDYILDATADLTAFAAGEKADGDNESVGTNGYFTVFYSAKTKVDGSNKTFEDGYAATQRLNFGGKSDFGDVIKNAVMFKTSAPATVKIWWVSGGDGREMAICDASGSVVTATDAAESVKNALYISELALDAAGTYYLAVPTGSNYLFKLQVTETSGGVQPKPERAAWDTVAAPVITAAADNGAGEMKVTVAALVGYDGADEVVVVMTDSEGNEIASKRSVAEKGEHNLTFTPAASGSYTFTATLSREECEDKVSESVTAEFVLPLGVPALSSATSAGGGKVDLVWSAVKEADSYNIYCDGVKVGNAEGTEFTVTGLTLGQKYSFQVSACRGEEESALSAALEAEVTADAQTVWGFTRYGSSTNDANNGYIGSVNEDGKVTVYSEGGKGKIVPNSTDGVAFYYTVIPTEYNFTLRATVTVDSWTLSNGQEGFGLMATDRLGPNGDSAAFWNNQYMALASKVEYYNESGAKYSMKLGLGVLAKTGLTPENLPTGAEMPEGFSTVTTTLDNTPEKQGLGAGTYNIVGNATAAAPGTIAEYTSFILEIQKNNTGYFVSYYDSDGNLLNRVKHYDPDALSYLDSENVYAGFFAARNARITVTDINLTTIPASEDAPAEEKPVTYVEPAVTLHSSTVTTSPDYTVSFTANVAGTARITIGDTVIEEAAAVSGNVRYDKAVTLSAPGEYEVKILFTPDPDQDLGEDTKLSSTDPVTASLKVSYNAGYAELVNLYVSPNGKPDAAGTREDPLDVYTAVENVKAGQTIVVMEGTYALSATVRIQKGINGTEENPIRMVADPQAKSRPVFDFQGICAGIVHGGDYWYFQGFDVTRSQNGQKGFQVSGNHNTLDRINTYHNGNTGIQISRYSGADTTIDQWPSYNLVLNCTSYGNADAGYEDADGFAAKLTCGVGNVFDGCMAYNNADDGWDLYAKVETGPIGSVTIRNCVAYSNGYLEDGTNAGNGNGFKMGGESISGKHVLINSYAFFNKAKGIDSNSCPDIIVENSTSYNNESYNVAFYTNNAANTDFSATGIISFKYTLAKAGFSVADNLKPKGTQDTAKYLGDTNYYWNGSQSLNASGDEITAEDFVSLEFKGVLRNADGTIDLQGFLELKEESNAGAAPGGTGSEDVQLQPDPEKPEDPTDPTDPTEPTEPDEPTDPQVDTTQLEKAIAAAKALKEADYTKKSYNALKAALKVAEGVLADENATQDEVDSAANALNKAIKALVPATGKNPETGDDALPGLMLLVGLLSLAGMGLCLDLRRKNRI